MSNSHQVLSRECLFLAGARCFRLKENIINEIAFDSIAKALGIDHGTTVSFFMYLLFFCWR